jgi:hypothetical protein
LKTLLLLPLFFVSSALANYEPFIIGGSDEQRDLVIRSTVALRLYGERGWEVTCSGSYIGSNKVVTASHCIKRAKHGEVYFILKYPKMEFVCFPEKFHVNDESFNPDDPDSYLSNDDLAVITLKPECKAGVFLNEPASLLSLTKNIVPFRLESYPLSAQWLSGFGSQRYGHIGANLYPLHTLSLKDFKKILTREEVRDVLKENQDAVKDLERNVSNLFSGIQSGTKSCYLVKDGKTPYFGDSGGPAYLLDSMRNPVQTALFSFMIFNRRDEVAAFCNINLAPFNDWIKTQK